MRGPVFQELDASSGDRLDLEIERTPNRRYGNKSTSSSWCACESRMLKSWAGGA
jgi:hypothetical protein